MGSYIENGSSLVDTYRLISTMYQIGQWWQENKISVADEHLATATCDYIIARLQFTVNKEKLPSKRALLFCVEGEGHYIGLKMLASLLEKYKWEVGNLGANLSLSYAFLYHTLLTVLKSGGQKLSEYLFHRCICYQA
ncbi:cobalamin B12-binding domain-containing protein [Priestia flexa]|uniref:cobalamin B12-binding domain-containing protein n=1 Tax=Priestia flexa TaxID=86664 RepID=UPI002491C1E4|nr:B12-binding domain-containing protein [Priestia flexa]